MAGCGEGIRRALVLGLVLIAWTAIEQALSVGPLFIHCPSKFIHIPFHVHPLSLLCSCISPPLFIQFPFPVHPLPLPCSSTAPSLFIHCPFPVHPLSLSCCRCLPTPMTLASGGSPMLPLVVHQQASPSIWPAVQSLQKSRGDNVVRMWEQLKR